jgi:hypothetical protein
MQCEGDFDDQIYDIAGNSWTTGAPSPFIEGEAAAVVGAQIYVAGGRGGGSYLSTLIIYDPASDTWTSAPNSPVAHYFTGAAVVNNLLYVVGGKRLRSFWCRGRCVRSDCVEVRVHQGLTDTVDPSSLASGIKPRPTCAESVAKYKYITL